MAEAEVTELFDEHEIAARVGDLARMAVDRLPGDFVVAREELARACGLPLSRVRIVVEATGGGFGSKLTLGPYALAAVELSRKAGAPVRLVLDRHEEQTDAGYRPPTWQRLRIGARRDGPLCAISLLSYGSAGVALGAGVGNVASRLYECANYEEAHYDVLINTTRAAPCGRRGLYPALSRWSRRSTN